MTDDDFDATSGAKMQQFVQGGGNNAGVKPSFNFFDDKVDKMPRKIA